MPQSVYPVAGRFTRLVDDAADARKVSAAVVDVLHDMDASLSPIIGRQSLLALLNRSVAVADANCPGLGIRHEAADVQTGLATLRSALARQSPAGAAACGAMLVANLHGSLTALIGHSLAERLLHNVGRNSRDGSL